MTAKRIEFTVPQEMWDRIEKARGHEARASFVKRALEAVLPDELALSAAMRSRAPFSPFERYMEPSLQCPKATCSYSGPEARCPSHKLPLKPRS